MMYLTRSILTGAILSLTRAIEFGWSTVCVDTCNVALENVVWSTTTTSDDYYTDFCSDTLRFESMWLCSSVRCSPYDITIGVGYWVEQCMSNAGILLLSYDDTIAKYRSNFSAVPVIFMRDITPNVTFNVTLLPGDDLWQPASHTEYDSLHAEDLNNAYAWTLIGYWSFILFIGMLNRLVVLLIRRTRPRGAVEVEHASPHSAVGNGIGIIRSWIRRHIMLPATFGYSHLQPMGWCTLPTRLQSLLVFIFVALNVMFCAVDYTAFDGNFYWSAGYRQIWIYFSDRTGVLATANFPLLWLFSSRNDIFLWLTGWNYATFNIFHRWVARVATVEAILHSVGFTAYYFTLEDGMESYRESWTDLYWYTGVLSTIAMSLLLIFSIYPLRQKAYELFLASHLVLALIALIGLFYHLSFDGPVTDTSGWLPYLWPCVAFWGFDHLVRWGRLITLNSGIVTRKHIKALAAYDAHGDIIRLTIFPSYHAKPQAGTHYYLYFPTLLKAVGNHPFSLSGWTEPQSPSLTNESPTSSDIEACMDKELGRMSTTDFPSTQPTVRAALHAGRSPYELHFLIRPYKGLTATLRDKIQQSPATANGIHEMTILLEGPYGETAPLASYESVLILAGGSGISVALSYLRSTCADLAARKTQTQRVHLVWAVRQAAFAHAVLGSDVQTLAAVAADFGCVFDVDIHITGNISLEAEAEADKEANQSPSPSWPDAEAVHARTHAGGGRPDVDSIVRTTAVETAGRLAVLVCGPAQMADDARRAAVRAVADGNDGLGYFEEQFGW